MHCTARLPARTVFCNCHSNTLLFKLALFIAGFCIACLSFLKAALQKSTFLNNAFNAVYELL
jgi:hypothetical protein